MLRYQGTKVTLRATILIYTLPLLTLGSGLFCTPLKENANDKTSNFKMRQIYINLQEYARHLNYVHTYRLWRHHWREPVSYRFPNWLIYCYCALIIRVIILVDLLLLCIDDTGYPIGWFILLCIDDTGYPIGWFIVVMHWWYGLSYWLIYCCYALMIRVIRLVDLLLLCINDMELFSSDYLYTCMCMGWVSFWFHFRVKIWITVKLFFLYN